MLKLKGTITNGLCLIVPRIYSHLCAYTYKIDVRTKFIWIKGSKNVDLGWRDGSALKSKYCSCKGSDFGFQQPLLWWFIIASNSSPKGSDASGLRKHLHSRAVCAHTYTLKKKKNNKNTYFFKKNVYLYSRKVQGIMTLKHWALFYFAKTIAYIPTEFLIGSVFLSFKFFITIIYLCVCMLMYRSENSSWELVLIFPYVGPRDWIHVLRLGRRHLCRPSHFSGPDLYFSLSAVPSGFFMPFIFLFTPLTDTCWVLFT